MTGFNVFDNDPRSMFLRLQVPITFQKIKRNCQKFHIPS